jgi:hypothetical protein
MLLSQPTSILSSHSTSAGYPMISHFTKKQLTTNGGFNIGGINASGVVSVTSVS